MIFECVKSNGRAKHMLLLVLILTVICSAVFALVNPLPYHAPIQIGVIIIACIILFFGYRKCFVEYEYIISDEQFYVLRKIGNAETSLVNIPLSAIISLEPGEGTENNYTGAGRTSYCLTYSGGTCYISPGSRFISRLKKS